MLASRNLPSVIKLFFFKRSFNVALSNFIPKETLLQVVVFNDDFLRERTPASVLGKEIASIDLSPIVK